MPEKTILVADDESHVLQTVSLKLRNAGYRVVTARDGQEALEMAHQEHPDLLITDYSMPRLSGLELCRKLQKDPDTSRIPAIMLTASGYNVAPDGIRRLLPKPFTARNLLTSVTEVLDHPRA